MYRNIPLKSSRWLLGAILSIMASIAMAGPLQVVATTPSLAMLANEIGGDAVRVEVLSQPDEDVHYIQARPSLVPRLRKADLLLAVGAQLEAGWLPTLVNNAGNARLLPGGPGYFEAASVVELIGRGETDNLHLRGHTHPDGNPHFALDPIRLGQVGQVLAERLASLDVAHAERFRQAAGEVAKRLASWVDDVRPRLTGAPGAVFYHRDGVYLLERFGLPVLGQLEPIPGVPPTAAHLESLRARLAGKPGVMIFPPFYPSAGPDKLAGLLGWKSVQLPLEPREPTLAAYLRLLDEWVAALAGARPG